MQLHVFEIPNRTRRDIERRKEIQHTWQRTLRSVCSLDLEVKWTFICVWYFCVFFLRHANAVYVMSCRGDFRKRAFDKELQFHTLVWMWNAGPFPSTQCRYFKIHAGFYFTKRAAYSAYRVLAQFCALCICIQHTYALSGKKYDHNA